jgi:hypothetical protein
MMNLIDSLAAAVLLQAFPAPQLIAQTVFPHGR